MFVISIRGWLSYCANVRCALCVVRCAAARSLFLVFLYARAFFVVTTGGGAFHCANVHCSVQHARSLFFHYVHARFVTIIPLFQMFTFNRCSHGKERRNIALSSGPGHNAEIEQMVCPTGQGIDKVVVINAPQNQIADQVAHKVGAVPCRQAGLTREPVHRR